MPGDHARPRRFKGATRMRTDRVADERACAGIVFRCFGADVQRTSTQPRRPAREIVAPATPEPAGRRRLQCEVGRRSPELPQVSLDQAIAARWPIFRLFNDDLAFTHRVRKNLGFKSVKMVHALLGTFTQLLVFLLYVLV